MGWVALENRILMRRDFDLDETALRERRRSLEEKFLSFGKLNPLMPHDRSICEPGFDEECFKLTVAMNMLPGLVTTSSCSGHGDSPLRVWFNVKNHTERGMMTLARVTCPRYYGFGQTWKIIVNHGDIEGDEVGFELEGPPHEADDLAQVLIDIIFAVRPEHYNILYNGSRCAVRGV